jgi:hypothetical protein
LGRVDPMLLAAPVTHFLKCFLLRKLA